LQVNAFFEYKTDVSSWTTFQVAAFLWRNNLLRFSDLFIEENISGDVLLLLTESDLKTLNIGIAHRRKLMLLFIEIHKVHSGQLSKTDQVFL